MMNVLTDEDRKAILGYSNGNVVDYDRAIFVYSCNSQLTDPHILYMKEATSKYPNRVELERLKELIQ